MYTIVLISPAHPRVENDNLDAPLGLMYLSAYLKANDYSVKILDYSGNREHDVPEALYYGFTTYTPTYDWCLAKRDEILKMYPSARMIAGGAHVTALPEECAGDWDCVIVGEGEAGLLDVVLNGIKENIVYSKPIEDIDTLPFPDYTDIDVRSYERELDDKRLLSLFSSRGCPYHCTFCNSIIWNNARKVRFRSPDSVAQEIEQLRNEFGIDHFRFVDDLFAISTKRVREMTDTLAPLEIIYRCTGRCNIFNADIAQMLAESGCIQVELGVESASQPVLDMMNKQQTPDDIYNAIVAAKDNRLRVRIYLIVGHPGETWETLNDTIKVVEAAQPDEILIHTPIPFPGSELYTDPDKFGIYWREPDFKNYMQISKDRQSYYLLSHKTADRDTIKAMWEYAVEQLSDIDWYYGKK